MGEEGNKVQRVRIEQPEITQKYRENTHTHTEMWNLVFDFVKIMKAPGGSRWLLLLERSTAWLRKASRHFRWIKINPKWNGEQTGMEGGFFLPSRILLRGVCFFFTTSLTKFWHTISIDFASRIHQNTGFRTKFSFSLFDHLTTFISPPFWSFLSHQNHAILTRGR